MAEPIIFYFNPMSRARIVRWMLEELGEPYEAELIEFGPPMKGPDYLAVNPMGKVPAIRHGRALVTEAGAICAYLADAFPGAGLAPPPGDPARGAYFRWMFFCAGPLEAATTDRSLGLDIPEERRRQVGYGCLEDVVAALDRAVAEAEFIAGDRFSAADVYVGSHLAWAMMSAAIDKRPSFQRYVERVGGRPAAIRARAIDDALIAERRPARSSAMTQGYRMSSFAKNAIVLGLLAAVGPFAIDMYLPALPTIAADLHASTAATQMTLMAFFVGLRRLPDRLWPGVGHGRAASRRSISASRCSSSARSAARSRPSIGWLIALPLRAGHRRRRR